MKKNISNRSAKRRVAFLTTMVTLGMFGFAYAMVPFYDLMCDVLGINGKTSMLVAEKSDNLIDKTREITVEFTTVKNNDIPWTFKPLVQSIKMHPGESKRVVFFAQNNSDHSMTVQAIPSVSPGHTGKYLNKTECFCFAQQTLAPNESLEMPVVFYFDKSLPKVPRITLAYTLFDVTKTASKN